MNPEGSNGVFLHVHPNLRTPELDSEMTQEETMTEGPGFDLPAAHKFFSADCFNKTWEYLDKTERTEQENQQMIQLAVASLCHWAQRDDCTNTNLSVGYWQASRAYVSAGLIEEARRYGTLSLHVSQREDVPPFFLGYAHEALARVEALAGNRDLANEHIAEAHRAAEQVTDAEEQKLLLDDLKTIG
jgi:hypothetical protein